MQKIGLLTAIFFMITAVTLGAFGAHGLKAVLTDSELEVFKTGVFYQFIHALGIILVIVLSKIYDLPQLTRSFYFFATGILFFSGSLYLLSTQSAMGVSMRFLGPITPLGGLLFIIGWAWMAWVVFKSKKI